jgi:uncharacterized membrane protein
MSQFPPGSAPPPPPPPPPPPGGGLPASGGNQPAEATAAIKYGWEKFKDNWGEIVVALIIGFAVIVVLAIIGIVIRSSLTSVDKCTVRSTSNGITISGSCGSSPGFFTQLFASALVQFLIFLGSSILQLFVIRATLMLIRGERLEASKVMSTENLGTFMVAAVIVAVLTFVGFLLCILPGIAVAFLTIFWGYFLVDKQLAPMDAIKASYELVKNNVGPVILFLLLSWVVLVVGAIACGIGLIVAWPVVIIATGYMYKRLQGEPVAA